MNGKIFSLLIVVALLSPLVITSSSADSDGTNEEMWDAVWFQSNDSPDMTGYNMDLKSHDQESPFVAYHQGNNYYLENGISLIADVYDTNSLINEHGQECTEIKVLVSATAFSESVTPPTNHYYNGYGIRLSSYFSSRDNDAPPGKINVNTGSNYGTNTTGDNWYNQDEGDTPNIGSREIMKEGASHLVDHFTGYPISGLSSYIFDYCGASKSTLVGDATDFHEETFVEFQNVIGYNAVDSSYQAATVFSFEMPHDSREYSLHISATNLIGSWLQGSPTNNVQTILDSAESTIIINIYNGEIQSVDSNWAGHSPTLSTTSGQRYWSDDISVDVTDPMSHPTYDPMYPPDWEFSPIPLVDIKVDFASNLPGYHAVEQIEDWEPYSYVLNGWNMYEVEQNEITLSHTYNLNDLGMSPGDSQEFVIEITASSAEGYGGWEKSISYSITIDYISSSGGGGGGGGGGGPTPPDLILGEPEPPSDMTWKGDI